MNSRAQMIINRQAQFSPPGALFKIITKRKKSDTLCSVHPYTGKHWTSEIKEEGERSQPATKSTVASRDCTNTNELLAQFFVRRCFFLCLPRTIANLITLFLHRFSSSCPCDYFIVPVWESICVLDWILLVYWIFAFLVISFRALSIESLHNDEWHLLSLISSLPRWLRDELRYILFLEHRQINEFLSCLFINKQDPRWQISLHV